VCLFVCSSAQRRMVTVIAARRCMRVLVCVFLCTRRMVTVIAARQCMYSCLCSSTTCLSLNVLDVRGDLAVHSSLRRDNTCMYVLSMYAYEMYGHCLFCRVMRVFACVYMRKEHAHGDCCEAMHACVGVCVLLCIRRMVTVIAARRCMRVLVCVLLCTRRMVTVIAARRCMRVWECMSGLVRGAWSV
jgi:hypothetical protein